MAECQKKPVTCVVKWQTIKPQCEMIQLVQPKGSKILTIRPGVVSFSYEILWQIPESQQFAYYDILIDPKAVSSSFRFIGLCEGYPFFVLGEEP